MGWGLVWGVVTACGSPRAGVDPSRMAVVGDSQGAGFSNGSLLDVQQEQGFAALVAKQAGSAFTQPLVAAPGIPNVLVLKSAGPPPVVAPASGTSPGRDDPAVQPTNFAVPGATLRDALDTRPDLPFDSLTDLVLGVPSLAVGQPARSQVEWVEAMLPTLTLVWIGNNDSLGATLATDPSKLTSQRDFDDLFTELMRRISRTKTRIAVANLADSTTLPFFTPASAVAQLVGRPLDQVGPVLGIADGDSVTPDALASIQRILSGQQAGPLANELVLTAAEAEQFRQATQGYNAVIAREADAKGAALVDVHSKFVELARDGIEVDGRTLTTQFLGGLISLDGIHPTSTGYELAANLFIDAIDRRFEATIPPVVVTAPSTGGTSSGALSGPPPVSLGVIDAGAVAGLRKVLSH